MHELGVVIEVVKTVENFAKANDVTQIEEIVLQIGELSSMIPKYVKEVFPMAVYETIMEQTKLTIEILPANALCQDCRQVYNLLQHQQICPKCKGSQYEMLSGREFVIKEIRAC